ncbi:thiamine ABC transporter ATP-binding protein [Thioclava sp. SK-1]|uniref:thiamine ABC transporter ATP-binding protein n=1 Tax=Thioclava sp. SK-1 TaxID=1889770 RepID=UPI000824DFA0|nr:ATP-binding cassette domain-containing protein [Thioclava sp. SK-1]OCX65940.1 thiamine ABC transporter ATP-binding protein [Thioclava sp. SK-1]
MLTLDNLILRQNDFTLRANISLAHGSSTAIIGPSGAGKSTLLSAIAGFLAPSAGRISWQGQDITTCAPGKRPLSILFQDQNLFPHLTIAQNLGLGLSPRLRLSDKDRDTIAQALADTGLTAYAQRKPPQLSGGQQSRAALARTLLRNKPILLLDEAFAALGPALKSEMLDLTGKLTTDAKLTTVMVTHDPDDAAAFCPNTIAVTDGVAHPPCPTQSLLASPPPALRAYLGA